VNEQAKAQVEAFIDVAKVRYGLSDDDIAGLVSELVRLQARAAFARRLGEYFAKAVITVLVAAFFSGVAWAVVHFVHGVR